MAANEILRTPDSQFVDLPDYSFDPHYTTIVDDDLGPLRLHHLDEGPSDGPVALLLHGEPTWSFLYRKMIPPLAAAGFRVLAPDFIGFGKSDKPADRAAYSYGGHVGWMKQWLTAVDPGAMTLFGQDWGGLIGLRLVAEMPVSFDRVMIGNTALPTGDHHPGQAFLDWREYSQSSPSFRIGGVVARGTVSGLSDAEIAAYDAPFPDESYKAGARAFPSLVPITPDDPAAPAQKDAWASLKRFDKPFLTCFSDKDPIMKGGEEVFKKLVPGAAKQEHFITREAGHFLQEDAGPYLARKMIEFIRST